jgi:hypothetical protein
VDCNLQVHADYVLVIAGVLLLFQYIHAFIDITFPLYNDKDFSHFYDPQTKKINEGGYWMYQVMANSRQVDVFQGIYVLLGVMILIHLYMTIRSNLLRKKINFRFWELCSSEKAEIRSEGNQSFIQKWKDVLDIAGLDINFMVTVRNELLLREELQNAGVSVPGDRLRIIKELESLSNKKIQQSSDSSPDGIISQPDSEMIQCQDPDPEADSCVPFSVASSSSRVAPRPDHPSLNQDS